MDWFLYDRDLRHESVNVYIYKYECLIHETQCNNKMLEFY